MKFLIFNLTVAAALVYLMTTDRAAVTNAAGAIHDAASEMKQAAGRVVDRGRRWVARTPPETAARASSLAAPTARAMAKPAPVTPAAKARTPMAPRRAVAEVQWRVDATFAEGRPGDGAMARAGTMGPRPLAAPRATPAPLIPVRRAKEAAAAMRRAEILRGIDPAILTPGPKPEAETATPVLTPKERRKQLDALSEEMELFYARTLGQ